MAYLLCQIWPQMCTEVMAPEECAGIVMVSSTQCDFTITAEAKYRFCMDNMLFYILQNTTFLKISVATQHF